MTTSREPRWAYVAYSAALGLAGAAATVAGGGPAWMAIFWISWMIGIGVLLAHTPYGRLRSASLDEREQSVSLRAASFSGEVLTVVIIAMFLLRVAQGGRVMPWLALGVVSGLSYGGALAFLHVTR